MVGVLEEVLAQHTIAGRRCITRELKIALVDHHGRPAHLATLRSGAFHRPVGILMLVAAAAVLMSTTARPTAAAPLTLHREFTMLVVIQ